MAAQSIDGVFLAAGWAAAGLVFGAVSSAIGLYVTEVFVKHFFELGTTTEEIAARTFEVIGVFLVSSFLALLAMLHFSGGSTHWSCGMTSNAIIIIISTIMLVALFSLEEFMANYDLIYKKVAAITIMGGMVKIGAPIAAVIKALHDGIAANKYIPFEKKTATSSDPNFKPPVVKKLDAKPAAKAVTHSRMVGTPSAY